MIDKMIAGISPLLHRLKSRKGQTLVEYALILAFMSVLCIVYMASLGMQLQGLYLPIINALADVRAAI